MSLVATGKARTQLGRWRATNESCLQLVNLVGKVYQQVVRAHGIHVGV